MKKSVLRLPKLKTRDELLRTAPELGRFLAVGDSEAAAAPAAAAPGRTVSPLKPGSPARARSPAGKRAGSPRRLGRKFSDDETTEEDRVRAELERVKQERAALLESLAALRADQGKTGGELQQEDIRLLRRELEAKQDKLNELRRATHELAETLEQLETTSRDCQQLMPQDLAVLQSRVVALTQELAAVEQDILEAEAKHELYKLLEIRTRRDHSTSEQRMREARALKEGAADDFTTLAKQMHEMRAAKEDAERELGAVVMMYDHVRGDWHKKLKDRRKEVRELERRKAEDAQRREQQAAVAAEKARIEQEKAAKSKSERDAANSRLSAVVPQLEVLEATWARLHGICGAATAEDLIAYWQELKAKEANMRELVRLAEVREARAKEQMAQLLAERAEVFDSTIAAQSSQAAQESAAAPAQQQQAEAVTADTTSGAPSASGSDGGAVPGKAEHNSEQNSSAAQQESDPGQPKSNNISTDGSSSGVPGEDDVNFEAAIAATAAAMGFMPAVASQQQCDGEHSEAAPPAAGDAGAGVPETAVEQLLQEKQALIAEARRRKQTAKEKFNKLSQVCVAADQGLHLLSVRLKAAMEAAGATDGGSRRRSSVPTSRRVSAMGRGSTGQRHVVRRMSAVNLMERRASVQLLPVPGEPSPRMPVGSKIQDKEFFPELPAMLTDVNSRLGRLLSLVEELQAATAAVEEASATVLPGPMGSSSSLSSSLGGTEASESAAAVAGGGGSRTSSSKRLQWADRQSTPRVEHVGEGGSGEGPAAEKAQDTADPAAAAAAAQGEKALRRGFRRRTWAGPAWLDAVSSAKPLTATLRDKRAGSRGPLLASPSGVASSAALQRIVGYVEEPGSSDEDARVGANPFDLGSSEDEMEEDTVVDRQYLKHRAHKLTHPKVRGKQGGSSGGASFSMGAAK